MCPRLPATVSSGSSPAVGTFPRASLSVGQVPPIAVLPAVLSLNRMLGNSTNEGPSSPGELLELPSRHANLDEISFINNSQV